MCNGELPKWSVQHTRKPLEDIVLEIIQESFSLAKINDQMLEYGTSGDKQPVEINYSAGDHRYQLLYHYTYYLSEYISPPSGWTWKKMD